MKKITLLLFVLLALCSACTPRVTITEPEDGAAFTEGDVIVFKCEATDPQDGKLPEKSVVWYADTSDTIIGKGTEVKTAALRRGAHTVGVTATNSKGKAGSDEIRITVGAAVPATTTTVLSSTTTTTAAAAAYYVAPHGSDANPGTEDMPWQTIQKAAAHAPAGSIVYVRQGVYNEQVTIEVSGSAEAGYITFRNAEGETPVLDGTGLVVPDAPGGMFLIADQSYIIIQGFEIRNYRAAILNTVPAGIHIRGSSHHIQIKNNRIHHIEASASVDPDLSGADAHGIAVYGTDAPASIHDIIIDSNELFSLKLGSSEALVLNGNVEQFTISRNTIHDVDNIGIDIIGFEGTAAGEQYDQARSGIIQNNVVYNASSSGNPSYGGDYSAGGIYVDGGRDIAIEMNTVYRSDIGIEVASEHAGRNASRITVRSNMLHFNALHGISLGGYDQLRGGAEDCAVINNTLYRNNTLKDGSGEIGIMFATQNSRIINNIVYANEQSLFTSSEFAGNTGNLVDYNIYYAPAGRDMSEWEWQGSAYEGFDEYRNTTGLDAHALFTDPGFVNAGAADMHLLPASPAVNAGETVAEAGAQDIDGQDRVQGGRIDIGADECR